MVPAPERIQDVRMDLLPACASSVVTVALLSGLALASAGCAATLEGTVPGPERAVVAVDAPASTSRDVVEVTEVVPPVVSEAPAPRRRLSQTVTLGASEPIYAAPPPALQGNGAGGPNVIVNNNVTVVNGQPSYGYGTYGYYGGYGYGYGQGRASGPGERGGRAPTNDAWAPTGWEGAQRTAAPGRTPGVGGNWAPPADHGPRQMK